MIKLPTKDEEKLKALKDQMNAVEMYSQQWFKLKDEYQKLFNKIEKARRTNE